MKKLTISITVLLFLLSFEVLISQPSKYEGKTVKKILFQGLQNINEDDLLYIMKTTVGYPLKGSEVREDVKKIFKKGKLQSIVVEIEEYMGGVRLRFNCKERPIIKSIEFKGHDEISETDLTGAVLVKEGDILRKDYLEKSVKLLRKKYDEEGLFNAIIRYRIISIKGDDQKVKIIFIIDEGEEIKVKKLSLLGVKKVHPGELKWIMETAEDSLFKDGAFKKDVYEQDKAKIAAYYKQYGYLDAEVIEDSVEYEWVDPEKKDKRCIFITIKVKEGDLYYFDGYSVTINTEDGDTVFYPESFTKDFLQEKIGSIFNNSLFQQDLQSISFKYASRGYIFARVIPKRTVTEREVMVKGKPVKRKFVKIDFIVDEGVQAYIDMIIIKGNKKTKDKVIRRELVFKEGELFDSRKLQISREKVHNLGFFKQVNIDVRPGSREGFMNLIVDVEEQPTGTISLGGGYGTTSGFSIFADIGENNLLGNGQRIGVRFEYGPERSSISINFTERWLFNQPLSLSSSIFYNLYNIESTSSVFPNLDDQADYKKQSFGYSLGLNYRFLHYYSAGATWSHAFTKIQDPSGNSSDEVFLSAALGWQEKRSLIFYVSHDSRDNYMTPTSGARISLSVNFTGGYVLGGEDHYIKITPEVYFYFSPFHLPFLKSHPCVFELRASGTFIQPPIFYKQVRSRQHYLRNPWLEPEDRLFLGGPETLRGWDYYDNRFPESWREVGMFHRILWGVEFRVPIHPRMLWLALFFDAGSLWSDPFWEGHMASTNQTIINEDLFYTKDLKRINNFFKVNLLSYFKYSYGFGFRVQIPMMPLRFWFGQKLIYDGKFKHKGGFTFQFAIGDMRF